MSQQESIQSRPLPAPPDRKKERPSMSEQELIRALQDLVARHANRMEPRHLGSAVIWRDRWRLRLLAGLTALLWLIGIAGVLYMIFWFNRFIIAYSPLPPRDANEQRWRAQDEFHSKMELHHSLEYCMVAVPALLLAALATVWLVLSSRRATLNQINLSLADISEQLRELRQETLSDGIAEADS